ncbi:MAG: acylphosphatase [Candidatus Spechtbacteria bacterium RIFCSPHIGHO2_02_FULL_43_15b]|uniref:Acylphosphatase n=1 Tax=Candidatus Spechtbacteria bacterium RIFCSPHIGHO2_01_FULL_43_30 TaxID=1802158 RepID=A0A1G2H8K9_9BACT|nr:MAG: acylphosphatase [Candidatus Spechtbacteria bacterium RIFCSPHIGHO2_01_FULL_43_30]OGZ59068.1 MAG: acylphosphatase [Candidatus Spechtbacteria bacterium RIFCSPHIGHO2_02_FULL_43_15b]
MTHLNIKIYGKVQGVFFRSYAKNEAEELSVKGFVKNEIDGSVYMESEGERPDLEEFIERLRRPPKSAKVERVDVEEGEIKGYNGFDVIL